MNNTHYRNLINYVDNLVVDKAERTTDGYFLSLDDLYEDELNELAVLFLEYDERDTTECFYEADQYAINDNITCALLTMLKQNNPDTREDFAELVRKNVIRKYRNKMQEMIDEQCAAVEGEIEAEHGRYKHQDRNTGEHHWLRV